MFSLKGLTDEIINCLVSSNIGCAAGSKQCLMNGLRFLKGSESPYKVGLKVVGTYGTYVQRRQTRYNSLCNPICLVLVPICGFLLRSFQIIHRKSFILVGYSVR